MNQKTIQTDTYQTFVDENNIIHVIEQEHHTIESLIAETKEIMRLARLSGSKKVLVNLTKRAFPSAAEREIVIQGFKKIDPEKIAIYGEINRFVRIVAEMVVKATRFNTRFFRYKDDAITWLLEK